MSRNDPALITAPEAADRLGLSLTEFRRRRLPIAGTYTPPRGSAVELYSRFTVDASAGRERVS